MKKEMNQATNDIELVKHNKADLLIQNKKMAEEIQKIKKIEEKNLNDIANLQNANQDLIERNVLFEAAQKQAGFGVWEIDLATSEVYWSDKVYEIHEVPKGTKIVLDDGINFYRHDYQSVIKKAVQDAVENGRPWDLEMVLVTSKNKEVWVRAIGWAICKEGKTNKLGGLFQDITKKKKDEQQIIHLNERLREKVGISKQQIGETTSKLKFSEAKMTAIVNTAADAIIIINEKGIIGFINKSAEEIFGYALQEVEGKNIKLLMPNPYREEHDEYLKRYMKTGVKHVMEKRREVKGKRKNGDVFPLELAVSEFMEGDRRMFTGIIRDISERRKAEKTVIRQSKELQAANKELESFSYSVSHDLRSPLRSIQGFSQALLEDCNDSLSDVGKGHLKRISGAATRMGGLIDDLLKLSRLSRKKTKSEIIDIGRMATSIVEELNLDPKYSISIGKDLSAVGDPKMIEILLTNLIENAVKYSSKIDLPSIEINESVENDQKWFSVKDNGAGFDMAYADKLFGAFQRLHSRNEFEGTGIGLATVQRIINKHGGKVKAYGKPGQGAIFSFTLNLQN